MNNKKTLTSLFAEALYQIPRYQRGYAWEEKQWSDFIQDVDALVEEKEKLTGHYTGTVVVYSPRNQVEKDYGTRQLPVLDVVDGQQRLTTSCLYLSVILRALIAKGETDFERDKSDYLYSGATCKLTLGNDTNNVFLDLLKTGRANTAPRSPHEKRLIEAHTRFQTHIDQQLTKRGGDGLAYLKDIYRAISAKLHFTFYVIEEECEIGMTFELMNSRGKDLSVLELLKNYLMHWVYRNEIEERASLTDIINKSWSDTYKNLGECDGSEDQCLRIAWTLYWSPTPAHWNGYEGFKADDCIPLRHFTSKRTPAETKAFIKQFVDGLAEISKLYATIANPTAANTTSPEELRWLTKIHCAGNIANFLPLLVAARKQRFGNQITEAEYIALFKALECYAYRVFLFSSRRSNAGKSSFYGWGHRVFSNIETIPNVTALVHGLTRYYSPEESFVEAITKLSNWYGTRHRLKYTLFEYELALLDEMGHGRPPRLKWEDLSDSTIEHVLPQTPGENSHWKVVWSADDANQCLHDIGNLVLTLDNSRYYNFEFARKKGQAGDGYSYSNSDIRQERRLAQFSDWTRKEFDERRADLVGWIRERWKTEAALVTSPLEVVDEADEDRTETPKPVETESAAEECAKAVAELPT
jgi:hypothetical protein